jgi:hypothetical protein
VPLLENNKKSDIDALAQWPKSPKEKRARGCGSEFESLLGHLLFLIAFMLLPPHNVTYTQNESKDPLVMYLFGLFDTGANLRCATKCNFNHPA